MTSIFAAIMAGVIRHVLTGVAGGTITMGLVTEDVRAQTAGIALGLAATLWSMLQKAGRPVIATWLRGYADRIDPPEVVHPVTRFQSQQ